MLMAARWLRIIAALSGAAAVLLGAYGAHGLPKVLTDEHLLNAYHTAVTYQFYHTLALLLVSVLLERRPSRWLLASGVLLVIGMALFCVSLYVLALTGIHYFGFVTPVGGVLMVLGWLALLVTEVAALRNGSTE